jgi:hypothetical protein
MNPTVDPSNLLMEDPPARNLARRFCTIYRVQQAGPRWHHYSTTHPDPGIAEDAFELMLDEIKRHVHSQLARARKQPTEEPTK